MNKRISHLLPFALVCLMAGAGCSRSSNVVDPKSGSETETSKTKGGIVAARTSPALQPKLRATLNGMVGPVAFTGDGKLLAVVSRSPAGPTVVLVDVAAGKETMTLKRTATRFPTAVAFSDDGKLLATAWEEHVVLWDVTTAKEKVVLKAWPGLGMVNHLAFSPDGKLLAAAARTDKETGEVKLWDVTGGKEAATLPHDPNIAYYVAFSGDGKLLATLGHDKKLGPSNPKLDCTVKLWDVATGKERESFHGPAKAVGEPAKIVVAAISVTFGSDGKLLALGRWDQTMKLWDVGTGQARATFKGHASPVISTSLSSDGKWLASGNLDGTITLWDVATAQERANFKANTGWVGSLAFDNSGTILTSVGGTDPDLTLKLWGLPAEP
jgi:WD40 repeat protein